MGEQVAEYSHPEDREDIDAHDWRIRATDAADGEERFEIAGGEFFE